MAQNHFVSRTFFWRYKTLLETSLQNWKNKTTCNTFTHHTDVPHRNQTASFFTAKIDQKHQLNIHYNIHYHQNLVVFKYLKASKRHPLVGAGISATKIVPYLPTSHVSPRAPPGPSEGHLPLRAPGPRRAAGRARLSFPKVLLFSRRGL